VSAVTAKTKVTNHNSNKNQENGTKNGKEWQYDLRELDPDNILALYMREMARVPLLTKAEERQLAMRMEKGKEAKQQLQNESLEPEQIRKLEAIVQDGEKARKHLIKANTRLVVSVVKRYSGRGVPTSDLVQGGNVALMRAVEKFDYRRGYKFSTYATWWIRQGVTRTLANQQRTIRVPIHMHDRIAALRAISNELEKEWGRKPTIQELAEELEITPAKVRFMLRAGRNSLSLEKPVGKEKDAELGDFLEDTESAKPSDEAARQLLREKVEEVLLSLTPREARILRDRFGLRGGRPHTLEEVGNKFGLTRERIRQLEKMALRKLRHPSRARKLRAYWR